MNLIAAVSILLVTILTFQTTVINGAKSLAEHKQHSSSKDHLALNPAAVSDGDSLVRKGRGAKSSNQGSETVSGVGKRGKNSKKLNKSTHLENSNAPATSAQSMSSDTINEERTKLPQHEQKSTSSSSSSSSSSGHQHNNKPKQRQMLKAQQHQTHVKRGGGNAKSAMGEKKSEEQKQTSCRYSKSAWTECDTKTNSRSRTLTLKKGESSCQQTRTIQKKCKKACRYEKGAWTECTSGQMTRQDKLKTTSDATCEPVRAINKKCNPSGGKPKDKGNKERKNKDKSSRKAAAA
ncbi:uncharacterized protein DDB_G0271670-like isoform X1 [Episyrphus balteatus]|uniref:uncharacterized protein DDB_G0271670-like isoform X1 n=1 Tax=Episyrphus balteatus TaxID=286459 RepID=UPI0024853D06|nr:uncharacterized protein DDB_G0271670-like isoform X1 [Episyrphus balteatus]XP_055843511.1 uncharacterized protein DDB_G0271670-like isoform X1 [Episyrphus balteatus]